MADSSRSRRVFFPEVRVVAGQSGSEALLELITILPGGMIISPIIKHFPGGKLIVRFIYNRFSRLHDMDSCHINNSDNNNNEYHTQ